MKSKKGLTLVLVTILVTGGLTGLTGHMDLVRQNGETIVKSRVSSDWWDRSWQYRIEIQVTENSNKRLNDYPLVAEFDTTDMISNGKMKEDGSDIRLVDPSQGLINYAFKDMNTRETLISFKADLDPGGSKTYHLYYGNPTAADKSADWTQVRYNLYEDWDSFGTRWINTKGDSRCIKEGGKTYLYQPDGGDGVDHDYVWAAPDNPGLLADITGMVVEIKGIRNDRSQNVHIQMTPNRSEQRPKVEWCLPDYSLGSSGFRIETERGEPLNFKIESGGSSYGSIAEEHNLKFRVGEDKTVDVYDDEGPSGSYSHLGVTSETVPFEEIENISFNYRGYSAGQWIDKFLIYKEVRKAPSISGDHNISAVSADNEDQTDQEENGGDDNGSIERKEGPVELTTSASAEPYDGISFSVEYSLTGEILPSNCYKGKKSTWCVELTESTIHLSGTAYVPGVVDESFDKSVDIPLGSEYEVPVAAGGAIKIPIKITADANNISVEGPGSTPASTLELDSMGKKSFLVQVSDNASVGDEIVVEGVEIVPRVMVGLKAEVDYGLDTWEKDIAKEEIGVPVFNQKLAGSAEVEEEGFFEALQGLANDPLSILLVLLPVTVIILLAIFWVKKRGGKTASTEERTEEYKEESYGVERGIDEEGRNTSHRPDKNPPPQDRRPTDRLRELQEMKEEGLITEEEYEEKKEKIIREF